ncbi:hypothetical protein [Kitasatospora cheerisanensis]|uniref:hypothetical protein n=1 Tax=Kitasatospora cheerisanensis TaxID=81942 RepID=UPI001FCA6607|nr:hypothetical protein [Kitasatospora cheerisanensis]
MSGTGRGRAAPALGHREPLRRREFAGLYASFSLTAAAGTTAGFALGALVQGRTGSPLLTALSMHGASFAAVLGATTLMSRTAAGRGGRWWRCTASRWRRRRRRRRPCRGCRCRPGSGCCWWWVRRGCCWAT